MSHFSHWHLHIKNQNKLQSWRLGSTVKRCRTCINALPDDLLIILLTIKSKSHSSVKPCLGNLRTEVSCPISCSTSQHQQIQTALHVFCAALLHQSAVLDQLNHTKDLINLTKKNELTQTNKSDNIQNHTFKLNQTVKKQLFVTFVLHLESESWTIVFAQNPGMMTPSLHNGTYTQLEKSQDLESSHKSMKIHNDCQSSWKEAVKGQELEM